MRLHSSSPPIGFGDETTSPPLSQRIGPSALTLAFYPLIHCTVTFDIHRGQFLRVDLRQGCALRQMDNRLCVVKSFNPGARARGKLFNDIAPRGVLWPQELRSAPSHFLAALTLAPALTPVLHAFSGTSQSASLLSC
jgi:hypothetical protein